MEVGFRSSSFGGQLLELHVGQPEFVAELLVASLVACETFIVLSIMLEMR